MPATELLYLSQLIFLEMDVGRHGKPSGGSPGGWLFIPGRSRAIMQIAYRLILNFTSTVTLPRSMDQTGQ